VGFKKKTDKKVPRREGMGGIQKKMKNENEKKILKRKD